MFKTTICALVLIAAMCATAREDKKPAPAPAADTQAKADSKPPTLADSEVAKVTKFYLQDQRFQAMISARQAEILQRQSEITQLQAAQRANMEKYKEYSATLCKASGSETYELVMVSDDPSCKLKAK